MYKILKQAIYHNHEFTKIFDFIKKQSSGGVL